MSFERDKKVDPKLVKRCLALYEGKETISPSLSRDIQLQIETGIVDLESACQFVQINKMVGEQDPGSFTEDARVWNEYKSDTINKIVLEKFPIPTSHLDVLTLKDNNIYVVVEIFKYWDIKLLPNWFASLLGQYHYYSITSDNSSKTKRGNWFDDLRCAFSFTAVDTVKNGLNINSGDVHKIVSQLFNRPRDSVKKQRERVRERFYSIFDKSGIEPYMIDTDAEDESEPRYALKGYKIEEIWDLFVLVGVDLPSIRRHFESSEKCPNSCFCNREVL